MSTPSSAIARIARGRTRVASVPALYASKRSPARWRSSPSAICERAELWVQRKSTRCFSRFIGRAMVPSQPGRRATGAATLGRPHRPWSRRGRGALRVGGRRNGWLLAGGRRRYRLADAGEEVVLRACGLDEGAEQHEVLRRAGDHRQVVGQVEEGAV